MFKVGDKVVFTGNRCKFNNGMIYPQINSIHTISGYIGIHYGEHYFILLGFETCYLGKNQYFSISCLEKLDETFATEVLEQIKEQIEQEELVLI